MNYFIKKVSFIDAENHEQPIRLLKQPESLPSDRREPVTPLKSASSFPPMIRQPRQQQQQEEDDEEEEDAMSPVLSSAGATYSPIGKASWMLPSPSAMDVFQGRARAGRRSSQRPEIPAASPPSANGLNRSPAAPPLPSSGHPSSLEPLGRSRRGGSGGGAGGAAVTAAAAPASSAGAMSSSPHVDPDVKPGEFVLRSLIAEFTVHAELKLHSVLVESLEKPLSKSLQRGEDPHFDQLISSLSAVAEYCLPSLLRTLFDWYRRQIACEDGAHSYRPRSSTKSKGDEPSRERDPVMEKRELAIDFIFCLVLIEVLKQIPVHPVPDSLLQDVMNLAFKHFKPKEGYNGPNTANLHIVADLYAEVIGVLAQSKFQAVRKKFMTELKELRQKEQSPLVVQSIISLIVGLKFFRVKMYPVEEFEDSFQFMGECAKYFLEVKDKDIKHALAGLFVEILIPVAATVKNEVNVPCLRTFVELLYQTTFELSSRRKHSLALFPLTTCLLCVSQKQFFLNNWHIFLNNCLSHLKMPSTSTLRKPIDSLQNRDPKMSRVALESLYRLLWVYMVRIKGESNTTTQSRLQSIVSALFPKGSRSVVPRDTPLNIFVKIIQFIAQERLDYAMREIIFDLLSVAIKMPKTLAINPERMNIGLRAFLVIADSLQKKECEPPMPTTSVVLPSGSTLRVKKTFLNKTLTEEEAKVIGMSQFYPQVRKILDLMLRQLDKEVGRSMTLGGGQNVAKETEITGERKPKIDLFRTCVAAIPRLLPDGMSHSELLEMLARLTTHADEELRSLACASLQSLMLDFPVWREDALITFLAFVSRDVGEHHAAALDNALRMLLQLLTQWRLAVQATAATTAPTAAANMTTAAVAAKVQDERQGRAECAAALAVAAASERPLHHSPVLHAVEGLALVMLCNTTVGTRRLAVLLLRETRALATTLGHCKVDEELVIDILEKLSPSVLESFIHLTNAEQTTLLQLPPAVDLQWLSEGTGVPECSMLDTRSASHVWLFAQARDPWLLALASLLGHEHFQRSCPLAQAWAWSYGMVRLTALTPLVDPGNPANAKRISAVPTTDSPVGLWRNYLVLCCSLSPAGVSAGGGHQLRGSSPETLASTPESSYSFDGKSVGGSSPAALFHLVVPLMRCESLELTECLVLGLGCTNSGAFRELMEELNPIIKEVLDKKQENVRKRKKRDILRVQLVRIFELLADTGVISHRGSGGLEASTHTLSSSLLEYVDQTRQLLEVENDKDSDSVRDARMHFSALIANLISHLPISERRWLFPQQSLRHSLFHLLSQWAGPFRLISTQLEWSTERSQPITRQNFLALKAMAAVLCCGPLLESVGLPMDGYLQRWLDSILGHPDPQVHQLGCEMVVLLLELNPELSYLLQWAVDRCYTGSPLVAAGCFTAIATTFTSRDWPMGMVTLLNLILFKAADPSQEIYEMALQLMQVMEEKLFGYTERDESGDVDGLLSSPMALPPLYSLSAYSLSEELARLYPELTLPLFSELSRRFQTTQTPGRQVLLSYLQPWLSNIQLVAGGAGGAWGLPGDAGSVGGGGGGGTPERSAVEGAGWDEEEDAEARRDSGQGRRWLKGSGWGSPLATALVLNNLLHMTAQYGEGFPSAELESVWTALADSWPGNLRVILQFLIALCGVRSEPDLLPSIKKVVIFICREKTVETLEELLPELERMEPVNSILIRTKNPPFYRLLTGQRTSPSASGTSSSSHTLAGSGGAAGSAQGPDNKMVNGASFEESHPHQEVNYGIMRPHPRLESRYSNGSGSSSEDDKTEPAYMGWRVRMAEATRPEPLPMPASLGYWARLTDHLPETFSQAPPLHRCSIAMILLTGLVVDHGVHLEWSIHLPVLLHAVFLGFDHQHPQVPEHSKQLLLHLLLVQVGGLDVHRSVARVLLANRDINHSKILAVQASPAQHSAFLGASELRQISQSPSATDSGLSPSSTGSSLSLGSMGEHAAAHAPAPLHAALTVAPPGERDASCDVEERARALVHFISTRKYGPLWNYEDISTKNQNIQSAEQLSKFLLHVVSIFKDSRPGSNLEQRLGEMALRLALACPSRHYAGRSFQMLRALRQPLGMHSLSLLLSRLVERVGDAAEETQGNVLEVLLTLETAVDTIAECSKLNNFLIAFSGSLDPALSTKMEPSRCSTGQLHLSSSPIRTGSLSSCHSASPNIIISNIISGMGRRKRSNSASQKHALLADGGSEWRSITLDRPYERVRRSSPLAKARSLTSLADGSGDGGAAGGVAGSGAGSGIGTPPSDPLALLTVMFWGASALLESDYESEYLMGLRLLERLLGHALPLDDGASSKVWERLEKALAQLRWAGFPGLQLLLLKGLTSQATVELTTRLLSRLTPVSRVAVIDASQATGFPLNVLCLLPHLVLHFDNPTPFCKECADKIAKVCLEEKTTKLPNLAHVMSMYSNRTYTRDCTVWISVVCCYIHDTYGDYTLNLVGYLAELLEKGLASMQRSILLTMHSLLSQVELTAAPLKHFNLEVMKVVSKYVQSPHWKEALNILKLVVGRSASLGASSSVAGNAYKGLPGKTLEFQFDITEIPIVGKRRDDRLGRLGPDGLLRGMAVSRSVSSASSGSGAGSGTGTGTLLHVGWKRPHLSQRRVRERLVNVLSLCGEKVGLTKNPSVIFSSDGELELLEQQAGLGGSCEEAGSQDIESTEDTTSEQQFGVFKDFDFLDVELEDVEGESVDNFNWGVRRRSLDSIGKDGPPAAQESNFAGSTPSLHRLNPDDTDESSEEDQLTVSQILTQSQLAHDLPGEDISYTQQTDAQSSDLVASLLGHEVAGDDACDRAQREEQAVDSEESLTVQPTVFFLCDGDPADDITDNLLASPHSDDGRDDDDDSQSVQWNEPETASPPPPAPFFSAILAAFCPAPCDDAEGTWRRHLTQLMADADGSCAVYTFLVFSALFQSIQSKFCLLTNDVASFLGEGLHGIGSKFTSSLEVLLSCAECPTVFVDAETLVSCNLLEKLKFSVLELQEHLDTYNNRRDATKQWLEECLRAFPSEEAMHPEMLMQHQRSSLDEKQMETLARLELCRRLYKLHFQLLLLFQAYCKLISQVEAVRSFPTLLDMSEEMEKLRVGLRAASVSQTGEADGESRAESGGQGAEAPQQPEGSCSCPEAAIQCLIECLKNWELKRSLVLTQSFRSTWPDDIFGRSEDDMVRTLLNIYFRHQTLGQTGALAVVGSNHDLTMACTKLTAINLQLSQALRQAQALGCLIGPSGNKQILSTSF
ncbi:protein furry homolog-like isoform X1 [Petromyzon marinus]|uniref:protein furry homolog-like isoform X1 n=1 Tax=Petromyzon marinus TaxID=7757 RepID=UPI003F72F657